MAIKVLAYQILFAVLSIIGFVLMWGSVNWGVDAANVYLRQQGGLDTQQFLVILESYTSSFRMIGAILAAIGGLGFLKVV